MSPIWPNAVTASAMSAPSADAPFRGQLEYEVEFAEDVTAARATKFHLHVGCFQAWEIERRMAR